MTRMMMAPADMVTSETNGLAGTASAPQIGA